MTSHEKTGLSSKRINDSQDKINHLICSICHEVLWKPVACQTCETPFCSICINTWLKKNPNKCPNQCESYKERKCPPLVAKLLAELQIKCFYEPQGCPQICSYDALEKHEDDCGFQPIPCSGCLSLIPKKDFLDHEKQCPSIKTTCEDCRIVYTRGDAETKHTDMICMKEQLRRSREEIQELNRQLLHLRATSPLQNKMIINFADLPSAAEAAKVVPKIYKGLRWAGMSYTHKTRVTKMYPKSGYVGVFSPDGSPHAAFFIKEATITAVFGDQTFNVVSLNACAAWYKDMQLIILGYNKTKQVYSHTATLSFGTPQEISIPWDNIDKMELKPVGGTLNPDSGGRTGWLHVILSRLLIRS